MTDWKKDGDQKHFEIAEVQYLRARHEHEGAYDVELRDGTVRVLPGGPSSTRGRLSLIASAIGDLSQHSVEHIAYLVGVLVLHGETNLEVDGDPIFDADAAEFRIIVSTRGTVRVVHDGGGTS